MKNRKDDFLAELEILDKVNRLNSKLKIAIFILLMAGIIALIFLGMKQFVDYQNQKKISSDADNLEEVLLDIKDKNGVTKEYDISTDQYKLYYKSLLAIIDIKKQRVEKASIKYQEITNLYVDRFLWEYFSMADISCRMEYHLSKEDDLLLKLQNTKWTTITFLPFLALSLSLVENARNIEGLNAIAATSDNNIALGISEQIMSYIIYNINKNN